MQERKLKILVIEDDKDLLGLYKNQLELNGFSVITALTEEHAWDALNEDIQAVWLDHYLPGGKDGLDFVRKVKSDKKFENIPIFVVSNASGEEGEEKIREYEQLGMVKFYSKITNTTTYIINDMKEILSVLK